MDAITILAVLLLGTALGAAAAWLILRGKGAATLAMLAERERQLEAEKARLDASDSKLGELQGKLSAAEILGAKLASDLAAEKNLSREKLKVYEEAEARLREAFKATAADTLKDNSGEFLKRADERLKPVQDTLAKLNTQVQELEKARAQAYGGLTEQVKSLALSQQKLETETGNLVKALRQPQQRGRWGEVQLRNVLEMSGLKKGQDYTEQPSVEAGDGRLRPDVVVKLPDGGSIVIDAKAPVEAFLNAYEAQDETTRQAHLKDHLRLVRAHIAALSGKEYWGQFSPSPEFVVLFLPGESFLSVALEFDPDLIGAAVEQKVILASPLTLIALLRAVAYGWRQTKVSERVEEIGKLGGDLYDRLGTLADHFGKVGDNLGRATKSYNDAVGSLERNVLPAARKMKELGAPAKRELAALEPVEEAVREVQSKELRGRGKALE